MHYHDKRRNMNGSSRHDKPLDPLEGMQQATADAAAERAALADCDDFDEATGVTIVNHAQPSQPDIQPEKVRLLAFILQLLPPFGRVVVLLAIIAAVVVLVLRGVKLW